MRYMDKDNKINKINQMKIEDILNIISIKNKIFVNEHEITKIEKDSRKVSNNDIFVATTETNIDGHLYINSAIENGAKTIICEKLPENIVENVNYFVVENSSKALGFIASEYYQNPSKRLKLIGITGTNGKTTIASSLFNLVRLLGYKSGLFSTIKIKIENQEFETPNTTPDQLVINHYLNEMVEAGCDFCFMEVSSHATVQNRISGLQFFGGVFTNITHDHLDFHKTFAEYIKAKQLFFNGLDKNAFALTNLDDKNGEVMLQGTKARKYSYSLKSMSDFKAKILENLFDGMLLNIDGEEVWTQFTGRFNAYNLLTVYAVMKLCNFEKTEILVALSQLKPITGRFETIKSNSGTLAIIDYAHTPDALKNVIATINEIRGGCGNLITVVGCGGDRDKTKRPKMAKIAAEDSDKVILTSDNPRTENPEDIINDMENGLNPVQRKRTLRICNRAEAIRTAAMLAQKNDIILIAGKGHENYQEINNVKHHFDDKEMIMECFNNNE